MRIRMTSTRASGSQTQAADAPLHSGRSTRQAARTALCTLGLLSILSAACTLMKPSHEELSGGGPAPVEVDADSADTSLHDAAPDADTGLPDAQPDTQEDAADAFPDQDSAPSCEAGAKSCGGACVDVDDPAYGCSSISCTPCALAYAEASCNAGACVIQECIGARNDCDTLAANGCESDPATDPLHCGQCNEPCPVAPNTAPVCSNGMCGESVCLPGWARCVAIADAGPDADAASDAAVDPDAAPDADTDADAAATDADAASQSDAEPADLGCLTHVDDDPANCGTCGLVCPAAPNAGPSCLAGSCGLTCSLGFADCNANPTDGCESESMSDPANCGVCGQVCFFANAQAICQLASCALDVCDAPWGNCNLLDSDGCEVDLSNNKQNCGTCGLVCSGAKKCVNSQCE